MKLLLQVNRPRASWAILLFLVGMFSYTGFVKIHHPENFATALSTMRIPDSMIGIVIWWVPVMELLTAGMLLLPVLRSSGLINTMILLLTFTAYALWARSFGPIQCGCFGADGATNIPILVARNLALCAATYYAFRYFLSAGKTSANTVLPVSAESQSGV